MRLRIVATQLLFEATQTGRGTLAALGRCRRRLSLKLTGSAAHLLAGIREGAATRRARLRVVAALRLCCGLSHLPGQLLGTLSKLFLLSRQLLELTFQFLRRRLVARELALTAIELLLTLGEIANLVERALAFLTVGASFRL